MAARAFYTITQRDVGKPTIRAFGRVWMVSGFLGRVLPLDVGKRVYLVVDSLQAENDAQRDERTRAVRTAFQPEVYRCRGCGRLEDECSANPCADVIEDRRT